LWLSDDVAEGWYGEPAGGDRGRPQVYGDAAIQFFLTIKYMYGLPYRAAQGFVDSLLAMSGLALRSPCYTQACRRSETLAVKPEPIAKASGHRDVVVDSTGLKVYGEGEWKVRKHGASKRRTWRKLHLAVDPATHEILAHRLTGNDRSDDAVFPELLEDVAGEVGDCMGDGAYDTQDCHAACHKRGAKLVAPPNRRAVPQKPGKERPELALRDSYVTRIDGLAEEIGDKEEARNQWKKETGYHRRSIGETAPRLRGGRLCSDSRRFAAQSSPPGKNPNNKPKSPSRSTFSTASPKSECPSPSPSKSPPDRNLQTAETEQEGDLCNNATPIWHSMRERYP